jgi:hypothetical protein
LAGAGATVSRAAQLLVLDDRRSIDDGHTTLRPAPGASLFDATLTIGPAILASQTSLLTSNEFSGNGTAGGAPGISEPGRSVFDVEFSVDAPTSFTLTGQLHNDPQFPVGYAYFFGLDGVDPLLPDTLPFSLSGQLLPEVQYDLLFVLQPLGTKVGVYQFQLTLPEPSELPFVSLAALALALRVRPASSRSPSRTARRSETARSRGSRR